MRRPAIVIEEIAPAVFSDPLEGWIIKFLVDAEGDAFVLFEHPTGRITEQNLRDVRFTDWERD